MDIDEEVDCPEAPTMKVNELLKLNESFIMVSNVESNLFSGNNFISLS